MTQILTLQPDQRPRLAAVLAESFMDDPFFTWLKPADADRRKLLLTMMNAAIKYCLRAGTVHSNEQLTAGAVWLPPGRTSISALGLMRSGMLGMFWPPSLSFMGRFSKTMAEMERLHKQDAPRAHWYLWVLGVDPPQQGKGLGSQVVTPALREADLAGKACYLETAKERNLKFYRRLGFEVVKEFRVQDSPPVWTMLRPPVD